MRDGREGRGMIFDNRIRKNLNIYTAGGVREGTTIERFGGVQGFHRLRAANGPVRAV